MLFAKYQRSNENTALVDFWVFGMLPRGTKWSSLKPTARLSRTGRTVALTFVYSVPNGIVASCWGLIKYSKCCTLTNPTKLYCVCSKKFHFLLIYSQKSCNINVYTSIYPVVGWKTSLMFFVIIASPKNAVFRSENPIIMNALPFLLLKSFKRSKF